MSPGSSVTIGTKKNKNDVTLCHRLYAVGLTLSITSEKATATMGAKRQRHDQKQNDGFPSQFFQEAMPQKRVKTDPNQAQVNRWGESVQKGRTCSFVETWVCDRCGSTTFDFEVNVGCDHEERSLHFVEANH